ncbi:MAG TPA: hypothetical protein VGR92_06105 [Steroidobacteraceae bacterium]|nr:hypothetical protein [Steroidobacteraceae bacterium]
MGFRTVSGASLRCIAERRAYGTFGEPESGGDVECGETAGAELDGCGAARISVRGLLRAIDAGELLEGLQVQGTADPARHSAPPACNHASGARREYGVTGVQRLRKAPSARPPNCPCLSDLGRGASGPVIR